MQIDVSKLPALMFPLLQAVFANLPAGTPPYVSLLVKVGLAVLGQFAPAMTAAHGPTHNFALPPSAHVLPPEDQWTKDGLASWAQSHVQP
jgi:hypothetical protein